MCLCKIFKFRSGGKKQHKQNQTQVTKTERTLAIYDRLKVIF